MIVVDRKTSKGKAKQTGKSGKRTNPQSAIRNPQSESVFDAANIQLQRRMRFNPLRMLTPENLSQYLDQFDIGILNLAARLWDAMVRRDDTLSFLKPQSEASIAAQPWGVFLRKNADPIEAAKHKACLDYFYDHVRATDAFDRNIRGGRHLLIQQMMSSDSYMYAVHHFIWDAQPGVMIDVPSAEGAAPAPVISATMEQVPLMYFENTTGTLRFLPMGGFGIAGQELDWENEWMCSTGRGVMFAASISYVFKRLAFQDWTVFNERYAQNKVLGQTNATQDSAQGRAMAAIIANFNGDEGIALYESQPGDKPPISLIGPQGTTSVDLFERFLERQDAKMSVLYRGSDRANEAGEKKDNGITAQMDETSRLEHSHCQRIADACQQGIDRKVIKFCFGEGVEPLAYFGLPDIEEDDAQEVRESAGFLRDSGALVDCVEIADRLGITLTEIEDDALKPPAAPGSDATDETLGDGLAKTANAARWDRLRELVEETLERSEIGPESTANNDPYFDKLHRFTFAPDQGGVAGQSGKGRPGSQQRLASIPEVVASSQGDKDSHDWTDYEQVTPADAEAISARTGGAFDANGYTRMVAATEVTKILRDHSSDHRPITPEDFPKVSGWLKNPVTQDYVTRPGKPPVLKTVAHDGTSIIVVEEIRTGRKKLALLSLHRP